jgi:hypothetical protein
VLLRFEDYGRVHYATSEKFCTLRLLAQALADEGIDLTEIWDGQNLIWKCGVHVPRGWDKAG